MDKLFDSPWMLRFTALVLAGLMFFYIQTEANRDTETGTSIETDVITNVPLEVYYDETNLYVTGLPKTVDVKISGPAPIVLKTELEKDFKVFVDLNSLLIGEHSVTIQQENFSGKLTVAIEPSTVNVVIEEKITGEFRVEPEMNNRLVAEDFIVNSMNADPSKVTVTGAKSVVDSINYVKATISGDQGIKESFNQDATVKVLDRDLNKLDVQINPDKVNVKVEVAEYSRELPITLKEIGETVEGVTIEKLTVENSKVVVFGTKSVVDSLEEVIVEVNRSKIKKSGSYEFAVILPTGVTKLSQTKATVHAEVVVEAIDTEDALDSEVESETNINEAEDN